MGEKRPRDEQYGERREPGGEATPEPGAPPDDPFDTLTPRELDILKLLGGAGGNKAIARIVGLGEQTVKKHVSSILRKLDMPDRAAAAAAYEKYLARKQREGEKRGD